MPYPWSEGDSLLAADLNAAIANAAIGGSTTAGGDLSGTYPNPTVTKLNGVAVAPSATVDTTNAANITSGSLNAARLPLTAVTPGSYINSSITVDATGRLTAASSGVAVGSVTSVGTGTGLTGGPITTSGTLALANTTVAPGSYTYASLTVDAQGRITAASSGTAPTGGTGTVTSVGTGAGLSGGPITSSGTITAQWQAGNVTALAGGLSLSSGTLTIAPLGYSQLPAEVQQLPIAFPFSGKPATGALVNVPMAMAVTVPASLAGTVVYDTTKTTANAAFTLNRITSAGSITAIGTITVTSTSNTSCTLAGSGASLSAGDTLQIVAPTQDATLSDIGITILAARV